jgi:hypothetical protein
LDSRSRLTPIGASPSAFGADRGQVGAGAEDPALTVQHRYRRVGIGVERAEGGGEFGGGGAVDGVAAGRAMQEDGGDGSRPLHPDRLLSHHVLLDPALAGDVAAVPARAAC